MPFKKVSIAALVALFVAGSPSASAQEAVGELIYLEDGTMLIVSEQGVFATHPDLAAELAAVNATFVRFEPTPTFVTRDAVAFFDDEGKIAPPTLHGAYR